MMSANSTSKCRACMCELGTVGSFDLQTLPQLAHKFVTCTALSLAEGADELHLPTALCQSCYELLEQLYDFRARCIASDAKWRLGIPAPGDEEKPNYSLDVTLPALEVTELQQHCATSVRKRRNKAKKQEEAEVELPERETKTVDAMAETEMGMVEEQSSLGNQALARFRCESCGLRFHVEHRWLAHKRQHEGLMPYPCTESGCEKAFNRFYCLSEHLKQHAGYSRWFSCEQEGCQKRYRHKPTLAMHMRKYHKLGPELKLHVCEFCGKVFNSTAVLNDHRFTHKDKLELPHPCVERGCSRRFSSKEKLKVHMMRHAGIKNFSCPYCGMRKTTRNELKTHMNYHTLERTWACRFCSKVCNSSGNLKTHVRTVHEHARDYACSYCERSFAKPDTRKYHEMTHTGERPNECQECGKRFTQPAALRTHRKIHERERKEIVSDSSAHTLVVTASKETNTLPENS